jgi:hypothetical protein
MNVDKKKFTCPIIRDDEQVQISCLITLRGDSQGHSERKMPFQNWPDSQGLQYYGHRKTKHVYLWTNNFTVRTVELEKGYI